MKYKKIKIALISVCILYALFIYIDILNVEFLIPSNILKYISIIICFFIAFFINGNGLSKKDTRLLLSGLFITTFADLSFLIFDYYILGIILFCFVQIIYFIRYKRFKRHKLSLIISKFITIFLLIITIYLVLNSFFIKIEFLFVIAFFYAICLISSTIESVRAFKNNLYPYPNKYLVILGMILFLLCDLSIAISSLTEGSFIFIHNISSLLIWIFYLPSQVLISLSGYKF